LRTLKVIGSLPKVVTEEPTGQIFRCLVLGEEKPEKRKEKIRDRYSTFLLLIYSSLFCRRIR
jgi:hypothetical protein